MDRSLMGFIHFFIKVFDSLLAIDIIILIMADKVIHTI